MNVLPVLTTAKGSTLLLSQETAYFGLEKIRWDMCTDKRKDTAQMQETRWSFESLEPYRLQSVSAAKGCQ